MNTYSLFDTSDQKDSLELFCQKDEVFLKENSALYDINTSEYIETLNPLVLSTSINGNYSILFTDNSKQKIYARNNATGEIKNKNFNHEFNTTTIINDDGLIARIINNNNTQEIKLINFNAIQTKTYLIFLTHTYWPTETIKTFNPPSSLTFNTTGNLLAIGLTDGSVILKNCENIKEPIISHAIHTECVNDLKFSHNNTYLVSATNNELCITETYSGKVLRAFSRFDVPVEKIFILKSGLITLSKKYIGKRQWCFFNDNKKLFTNNTKKIAPDTTFTWE